MGVIVVNGIEFTGKDISVKNGVLYIDGHAVADMKHDSDYIYVKDSGNCNINSDKKIIINDSNIYGNLTAETIIINDGIIKDGAVLNAKKIIDNR